jgi:hypothetical protein
MPRLMPLHLLFRRRAALLAPLVVLAGCGGGERAADDRPTQAEPARKQDRDSGKFPERPQVLDDFSDRGSGWEAAGYRAGAYVLRDGAAAAPQPVEPGRRGALAEVAVSPPRSGAAGLFCRGSADGRSGYALLLDAEHRVRLLRVENGRTATLKRFRLAPNERSDAGKPTLLRLACGTAAPGKPLTIGFTVNSSPFAYVRDARALPAGASTRAGLIAEDGSAARFDEFALWLAEGGVANR